MKLMKTFIETIWEKALVLVGALLVLLPVSPLNMPLTFRDSGVFLYFGWRILNGDVPYLDMWDHKPPVIFYINALGQALAGGSRWGVWILELAALSIAAWLGYVLIKKAFGQIPALVSLLLWLLALVPVLQGGTFTTEYTLPLQFLALWLAYHANTSRRPHWSFFFIGVTGAIAFFTKQTAIGIWAAVVIYFTSQRMMTGQVKQWLREIGLIFGGGLTFTAVVILFFGAQGALPQFWSAAFQYNFIYSARADAGLSAFLDVVTKGIRPLMHSGLFQFAAAGYISAMILILVCPSAVKEALPLLAVGLVDLPLELALIGMPGRTFPHYYMTLLPVLALLTGFLAWALITLFERAGVPKLAAYFIILCVAGYQTWNSFHIFMDLLYTYRTYDANVEVIDFIEENSSPDDTVLLWGAEASINYFAQRKSPTRFVYQYPLHLDGYASEEMIVMFLDEVIQGEPKFIIDTASNEELFVFAVTSDAITEKTSQLVEHYCPMQQIDDWTIYSHVKDGCK